MDSNTASTLRTELDELRRQIADLKYKVAGPIKDEQRTCTVGRGVFLGLVRAGDAAALNDGALRELDEGLKAIALHLVPRATGAPGGWPKEGPFPRARTELIALLNKVSLRADPVPGDSEEHFAAFTNPARGRDFRLDDARQGQLGSIPSENRANALWFETFVQLVRFRGLDLDLLP
ncbi:hypothetical protein DFP73DRAFT_635981 [Morchella snyderi]|nr:hypothetical protein DFP73DRAFT_635981 [Morchella snyderi]